MIGEFKFKLTFILFKIQNTNGKRRQIIQTESERILGVKLSEGLNQEDS